MVWFEPAASMPLKVALGALPKPSEFVPSKNCTLPVGPIPVMPVTVAESVTGTPAAGLVGDMVRATVGVACGTVVVAVWGV